VYNGAAINLYKCDENTREYREKMGSDYGPSDDISEYLDLLDEIDKKSQIRGMSGISFNTNEGFLDRPFVISLKY